jgi:hypothetical protein
MSRRALLTCFLCLVLTPALTKAQPAPDGGGQNNGGDQGGGGRRNRGGGGGGGGGFDPAQFRQQRLDRIKEQLGAKDDEWKVLEPKIGKVIDAQTANFRGFGGGFGGRNRQGGGNMGAAANNPVAQAMEGLRTTLDNKDASADDISKKLTALRDAREKARAELTSAQKDLKEVLTQRQEAVLVVNGMLE